MRMLGQLGVSTLVVTCLLACGPRLISSDAGEGTTSTTETVGSTTETVGSTTGSDGSTTETGDPSSETETETETGTDDGPGICGDGALDPGEECDDGNLIDDDGCSAQCVAATTQPCNGNVIFACGDGIDNDDDGRIDTDDLECNSPCDDTEDDLCDRLPGAGGADGCRVECAFDSNTGLGDDHCDGDWACYPPDQMMCGVLPPDAPQCSDVDPECVDFCVPLLPNGCDCFGCCEIDGQTVMLNSISWIGNQSECCDLDNLDLCQSCEIRLDCFNPCEPENCELCFTQTSDELPVDCDEPSCPPDRPWCSSTADCPVGWFCQTGCCAPSP
jgi:cysteine-rich repeat protein